MKFLSSDSTFESRRSSWLISTSCTLIVLVSLISISLTSVQADTMSAPETEIKQRVDVNACEFDGSQLIFCECDSSNEVVKCNKWGTSLEVDEKAWMAIGDLRSVTYIEFNNRPERALKQFPPQYLFSDLNKLKYFHTKLCEFDQIPSDAFANSSSISEIFLSDDMITTLAPKAFSNMKNLYKINMEFNLITEINRDVFINLPNLHELFLDGNRIQVIHDFAFKDLNKLVELGLKKNNLTVIAREVFSGLKNIIRLDLQSNHIDFLGDHVFADMPQLHELDLHGNQIRSISPTAFYGLKNLARLSLKDNKIVTLEPAIFSHMAKIYSLDLRNNALETLSETLIEPIYTNLKNVSMQLMLEGNRLMCDCRILWIQKLYKETSSMYVQEHLKKLECDLFHTPEQRMRELNHGMAVRYSSNVTVVAASPEETTTYAFDSSKNVIELNSEDFKCHEHHDQKDSESQDDSNSKNLSINVESGVQARYNEDGVTSSDKFKETNPRTKTQSQHQSHIDISPENSKGGKGGIVNDSSGRGGSGRLSFSSFNYYLTPIMIFLSILFRVV